nr:MULTISPECIES: M23 family metallopeptidase [Microbacterium]
MIALPLRGRSQARNSPADRVPSHGTHLFGTTYAIDLVPVDEHGRSARRGWRAWLASEPPERFIGFGADVLAPADGEVVAVHDGEPDHVARRSVFAGLRYLATQGARAQAGVGAIAGNHVVIALGAGGPFVLLAHLRGGSVAVRVGDRVRAGDRVGACDNSGNSTEPHVHLQVTDTMAWATARGVPLAFRTGPHGEPRPDGWMPRNGEIVWAR